jgi:hypothetical protein
MSYNDFLVFLDIFYPQIFAVLRKMDFFNLSEDGGRHKITRATSSFPSQVPAGETNSFCSVIVTNSNQETPKLESVQE